MAQSAKTKGVILAGGLGKRLYPLTAITNKHLLPVFNRPMISYPLETLKRAGINEIMVVCGKEHGGHFMNYLGSGKEFGVKLSYALQNGAGGIAEALALAEDFADGSTIAAILGDNLFEDDFKKEINAFRKGAKIFLKEVPDPERFGVATVQGKKVISIEEKPKKPKSSLAQTGLYLYGPDVFKKIRTLRPSARGELEITDVSKRYLEERTLSYGMVRGFWSDMGTFETLLQASQWVAEHTQEK